MIQVQTGSSPLTQKSAVALGFFDGVHVGHRAVLQAAVEWANAHGQLPCAFSFQADSLPKKQGIPLTYLYTDRQKQRLLTECGIAALYCPAFDALKKWDGQQFCQEVLVGLLRAEDVFCGSDFRFGKGAAWDGEMLRQFGAAMGFRVHLISPVQCGTEKISSTMIRQCMLAGKPEQAAVLLGAPYEICGNVGHGAALGHTQNVPTINLSFEQRQLVPRYGVYVSRTYTPEGVWNSITNIGIKPTVSTAPKPGAETFLLDFSGNLYGVMCRVELLHFLRPERQFPDLAALYAQIALDEKNCREWFMRHSQKKQ